MKKENQTRNSIDTSCSTLLYIFPVKGEQAVFFKKEFHGARQPPFIYKGWNTQLNYRLEWLNNLLIFYLLQFLTANHETNMKIHDL